MKSFPLAFSIFILTMVLGVYTSWRIGKFRDYLETRSDYDPNNPLLPPMQRTSVILLQRILATTTDARVKREAKELIILFRAIRVLIVIVFIAFLLFQ